MKEKREIRGEGKKDRNKDGEGIKKKGVRLKAENKRRAGKADGESTNLCR